MMRSVSPSHAGRFMIEFANVRQATSLARKPTLSACSPAVAAARPAVAVLELRLASWPTNTVFLSAGVAAKVAL